MKLEDISSTIERALASAGLATTEKPIAGAAEAIRNALDAAGIAQSRWARDERDIEIVDLDAPRFKQAPTEVGRFLKGRRIQLNSLVDRDGSVFRDLGLSALPSMFLLDAEGRPIQSYVGAADPREIEQDILGALSRTARHRSG